MEKTVERILNGEFEFENGTMDFSCTRLELSIVPGEVKEGTFRIIGTSGKLNRGKVFCTDSRMEILNGSFIGTEDEIGYRFHGENLEEGDVVKGEICCTGTCGEYHLPFVVTVDYLVLESSLGDVKNLFHFANLARTAPREAVELFYSEQFKRVFGGNDKQYYEYYLSMSEVSGSEQNVEEFLIGINKKQKIEYLLDRDELTVENPVGLTECKLTVTKNGWGYTYLEVETEGDFLSVSKHVLTEPDFSGNTCKVIVGIDSERLHAGCNFGKIVFRDRYNLMEVKVLVKHRERTAHSRKVLASKRQVRELMELYQAFRLKKIGSSVWFRESSALVERMALDDQSDYIPGLFRAQLLITQEHHNEAQWVLDHEWNRMERDGRIDPVTEAYYLYLTTLIRKDDEDYTDAIAAKVERLYQANREEWRIAWLLLYLSSEYNSVTKKWMFLATQFEQGCRSPIIYIEGLALLNQNPSLLLNLGPFEKALVAYGSRKEFLKDEVMRQFAYLVQKERSFSSSLYRILCDCYRKFPDDLILQEICGLLIRGNRSDHKYFEWFKLGVEHELRITRLYDYYLLSADKEHELDIPKPVLMYFSYQNNIEYNAAAYLYAEVYRKKDKYPELYDHYRLNIEHFLTDQLRLRHTGRNLAFLYKNILTTDFMDQTTAEGLAEVMFKNLIVVRDPHICYVILRHKALLHEIKVPVINGKALISMPINECKLVFEDSRHNRFMSGVDYECEKLLIPGRLIKLFDGLKINCTDLDLYICLDGSELNEITEHNHEHFAALLKGGYVSAEICREISLKLMQFYYENDRIADLDAHLAEINPDAFSASERCEIIRFMTVRGQEDRAYAWLDLYGPYGVDPKILVRICSYVLKETEEQNSPKLTETLYTAFLQGKYDECGLRYLTLNMTGTTRMLRDIYRAAKDFDVETYKLCERIILQILETGVYIGEKTEIFKDYVRVGARPTIEEAFLVQSAYDYFVHEKVTDSFVFHDMVAFCRRSGSVQKICKLALIKYYSENQNEIEPLTEEYIKTFISEFLMDNIRLKMFSEFSFKDFGMGDQLSEYTIVEYKAAPGSRAIIHYCLEHGEGKDNEYQTEEMREVYGGVCFKSFILFFGERVQYYIVEQSDKGELLTESANLQKSDLTGSNAPGKFGMIDALSISTGLQDYDTTDRYLRDYTYMEFLQEGLFKLK